MQENMPQRVTSCKACPTRVHFSCVAFHSFMIRQKINQFSLHSHVHIDKPSCLQYGSPVDARQKTVTTMSKLSQFRGDESDGTPSDAWKNALAWGRPRRTSPPPPGDLGGPLSQPGTEKVRLEGDRSGECLPQRPPLLQLRAHRPPPPPQPDNRTAAQICISPSDNGTATQGRQTPIRQQSSSNGPVDVNQTTEHQQRADRRPPDETAAVPGQRKPIINPINTDINHQTC